MTPGTSPSDSCSSSMKTPLLPGLLFAPEAWTIVHSSGDVIHGLTERIALTTRAAFDAWMLGTIAIPGGGWFCGPSNRVIEVSLLTPNGEILILEEAWRWKFSDECPQMHSAEDGRVVLEELLDGERTPEQTTCFDTLRTRHGTFSHLSQENLFLSAWQERADMAEYQRLEYWKPDAVVDPGGTVRLLRAIDCDDVTLVGKGWSSRGHLNAGKIVASSLLRPGEEVMVVEEAPIRGIHWHPQKASRQIPVHLGTLS